MTRKLPICFGLEDDDEDEDKLEDDEDWVEETGVEGSEGGHEEEVS
jgi:hypothetical protein